MQYKIKLLNFKKKGGYLEAFSSLVGILKILTSLLSPLMAGTRIRMISPQPYPPPIPHTVGGIWFHQHAKLHPPIKAVEPARAASNNHDHRINT